MVIPRDRYRVLEDDPAFSLLDLTRPGWMVQAACRGRRDLDWMDERSQSNVSACLEVCGRCEVRASCLAHFTAIPDQVGIAGGATAAARKVIRRAATKKEQSNAAS